MSECELRTAYSSDSTFRASVPSSPAARLGTVCHRVLELGGEGAFPAVGEDGFREAFEAAWADAVAEEDARRRLSPLESHWPPPERWPYYAVRKVATRRLCERMRAVAGDDGRSDEKSRAGAPHRLTEQRQQAFEGRLRGRADVIRRSPESEIEDYKTGSLLDETGDVKPNYRTQMLLYAVLEHEATGVWPKRATLVPLEGEPAVIEIDRDEAMSAAEDAMGALAKYNNAVAAGGSPLDLASPTPDACRYCPYSIECPAFWSSAGEGWLGDGIIAVAGVVSGHEESQLNAFNVTINRITGSIGPGDCLIYQLDAERFGAVLQLSKGDEMAALWLGGDADARELRATLRTRIAVGGS